MLMLPPTVLLLLTSFLSSVQTPLEYSRRFTRDTTPDQRTFAAVGAGERVQVAEDVVNFLQLYLLSGDQLFSNPWSIVSVIGRISAAAALGIDASWQLDTYLELLTRDPQLVSSYDPVQLMATTFLMRAAESLTLPPPAKRRRLGGDLRMIDDFCDSECDAAFRFKKHDLHHLFEALGIADVIDIPVRSSRGGVHEYHVCGETCFLVFLARMAKGTTYHDLACKFGFADASLVCKIFNHMLVTFDDQFGWLVDGSSPRGNLNRWSNQLVLWGHAVQAQFLANGGLDTAHFKTICLFIDGTFRAMDRVGETGIFLDMQRLFYTAYKKTHGLNYQAVTSPNGLIIDLWGPAPGRNNDLNLVTDSDIVHRLDDLFSCHPIQDFRCYGDSIYQLSSSIVRRYKHPYLTTEERRENRVANRERTTVEQVFGRVVQLWKYLDLKSNFRLLLSPAGIARAYRVACVLTNLKTCISGNQVGLHFGLKSPDVTEYLNGGTNPKL